MLMYLYVYFLIAASKLLYKRHIYIYAYLSLSHTNKLGRKLRTLSAPYPEGSQKLFLSGMCKPMQGHPKNERFIPCRRRRLPKPKSLHIPKGLSPINLNPKP